MIRQTRLKNVFRFEPLIHQTAPWEDISDTDDSLQTYNKNKKSVKITIHFDMFWIISSITQLYRDKNHGYRYYLNS